MTPGILLQPRVFLLKSILLRGGKRALSRPLRLQYQYIDEHMTISNKLRMRVLDRGPESFPCRAYNP